MIVRGSSSAVRSMLFLSQRGGEEDHVLPNLLIQQVGLPVRRNFRGLQFRKEEGIPGNIGQPLRLFRDQFQVFNFLFPGAVLLQKQGGETVYRHDRRFEFMGEMVDEVLPQGLSILKFPGHFIEVKVYLLKRAPPV